MDGLVQDCSISIDNALEILQSCTKPSERHFSPHLLGQAVGFLFYFGETGSYMKRSSQYICISRVQFNIYMKSFQYRKSHCGDQMIFRLSYTEMLPFWWNFHHLLHWKLWKWQLPVLSVMKFMSKWWHFHFSVSPQWDFLYWQDVIFILNQDPGFCHM